MILLLLMIDIINEGKYSPSMCEEGERNDDENSLFFIDIIVCV